MSEGAPAEPDIRYNVLSRAAIWWGAAVILVVGVGLAVTLLLLYGNGSETDRTRLDAIRTAGTIVVGTGGAVALLLAARRQRSTEIALRHKEQDLRDVARAYALQEQVAADAREDARQRRITDLYAKSAEQLGADKAPVRLAGMYALERLAQDAEQLRQTVVNLLCAYLRMPFRPTDDNHDEREVRLTAQQILVGHLRPDDDGYWADIDLDLDHATLINFTLRRGRVRNVTFGRTVFRGNALFDGTTFLGPARFKNAEFHGRAEFRNASFHQGAAFADAEFTEDARFERATFRMRAGFRAVTFGGPVNFTNAVFRHDTAFADVKPAEGVVLTGTEFRQGVPPELA